MPSYRACRAAVGSGGEAPATPSSLEEVSPRPASREAQVSDPGPIQKDEETRSCCREDRKIMHPARRGASSYRKGGH